MPDPEARARQRRRLALLISLVSLLLLIIAATGALPRIGAALSSFGTVHWGFLTALAIISALHYLFAALTLRGIAPCPLPLAETTMAQFTAAAANRVTPGGLGAAAVNTRYLICKGTPATGAAATVAAMHVAGAVADFLLLLLLLLVLSLATDPGGTLTPLSDRAGELLTGLPVVPMLLLGAAAALVAVLWSRRIARSPLLRDALTGLADLRNRPGGLCLTLVFSAATTLVLGVGLALSVLAMPGTGAAPDDLLALVIAYMVGSAAAAALPSPGGLGGTEAALVAAVTALGVATGPAIQAVLLFRAITYWAPVPVGLLTCRTLRRKVLTAR